MSDGMDTNIKSGIDRWVKYSAAHGLNVIPGSRVNGRDGLGKGTLSGAQ